MLKVNQYKVVKGDYEELKKGLEEEEGYSYQVWVEDEDLVIELDLQENGKKVANVYKKGLNAVGRRKKVAQGIAYDETKWEELLKVCKEYKEGYKKNVFKVMERDDDWYRGYFGLVLSEEDAKKLKRV